MYLFMIMKETIQQNFESGVCDFLSSHLTQPILLDVEHRRKVAARAKLGGTVNNQCIHCPGNLLGSQKTPTII